MLQNLQPKGWTTYLAVALQDEWRDAGLGVRRRRLAVEESVEPELSCEAAWIRL